MTEFWNDRSQIVFTLNKAFKILMIFFHLKKYNNSSIWFALFLFELHIFGHKNNSIP